MKREKQDKLCKIIANHEQGLEHDTMAVYAAIDIAREVMRNIYSDATVNELRLWAIRKYGTIATDILNDASI